MPSPRWQKVRRDLWTARGRLVLMIVAVAASLFALGTSLGAYAVLSRELARAYLATRPAAATLEMDHVDAGLVAEVRAQPGIEEAEARASVRARVRVGDDWRPLLLFVVPDFDDMRLATLTRLEGEWPPPRGGMLVDHLALAIVESRVGQSVVVKTPSGVPAPVRLAGVVWDSSLAPAGMERTAWGYITPETFADLGESSELDELKIRVSDRPFDAAAVEARARALARWLERRGHAVHEIQVPPPGHHPHQGQMEAVMLMLNLFSVVALLLSGVLVGSTVASMMSRQVREIGIMKTLGAGNRQVGGIYLVMMLVLGVAALAVAAAPAVFAARALIGTAAANLNLRLADPAIPWWVFVVEVAIALLVPVAAAAFPVARASRITVRQAIQDTGTAADTFGRRRLDAWLSRWRGLDAVTLLGARNAFRRPGRLALTLALLASGGAMFVTGIDTSQAWSRRLAEVNAARQYDVAIRLQRPAPIADAVRAARRAPGVATVEAWGVAAASWGGADGVPVVHTYPDRGHGTFQVVGAPAGGGLVDFPLLAGRWLLPADDGVVVLNHMAAAAVPEARVGSAVTITVAGKANTWRVVGFVRDLGSPATAYVPLGTFGRITGTPGATELVAVAAASRDPDIRTDVIRRVEEALEEAGLGIDISIPVTMLETAIGEHMAVLLGVILALAALMSLVGVLGLTAATSMAVVERTRELGVLQAVGAAPKVVLRVLLVEGMLVGALSAGLALVLAVPFSAVVAAVIGSLAFRAPLPLVVSPGAAVVWLALVILLSAMATGIPAYRASRMTVSRALAYE